MSIGFGYRDGDSFENITLCDKQELIDLFYPVGTCIWSTSTEFNPSESIGGSWSRITYSGIPRFAEDNNPRETGGSWQHKHSIPLGWDGHKGQSINTTFYYWYNSDFLPSQGSYVVNGWQTRNNATMAVEQGSNPLRLAYTSPQFINEDPNGQDGAAVVPFYTINCWERVA